MFKTCYTTVSDLAVCQRCPALFGYKIHKREKDTYLVGIKGSGHYYGSMFHKNIAQVFFEAASDSTNPLHNVIARAISGGRQELEEAVRENIFMPFVERFSRWYTSGQIMAAAQGVRVWVKAMYDFFREIPSLMRNPQANMSTVFLLPEQKLQAHYDFPGEGRLVISGRYDALMFNPDKAEARLFEFKGYSKSDSVVPLSQSLIYAWLIAKFSGIVPSVEIIYLDEDERKPDIFDPQSVKSMIISGLPGLFYAAFNTITLRRLPEIMRDKNLCGVCKFKGNCASDWSTRFRKRRAASLVNVIVFMAAAVMVTTHVFFFSTLASENRAVQAQNLSYRFKFEKALAGAIDIIKADNFTSNEISPDSKIVRVSDYTDFFKTPDRNNRDTVMIYDEPAGDIHVNIYDLYYKFDGFDTNKRKTYAEAIKNVDENDKDENHPRVIVPYRIFPPMIPESRDKSRYFMIRVYGSDAQYEKRNKKELMYQVLVSRDINPSGETEILSFQEVWY